MEGKIPIFLDKDKLPGQSYIPVECGVYSHDALAERGVIQHDPDTLALAIKGLYNGRSCFSDRLEGPEYDSDPVSTTHHLRNSSQILPFNRYLGIMEILDNLDISFVGDADYVAKDELKATLSDILLDHPVIPLSHLNYFKGLRCIDKEKWGRDQQWDNVFSFFDPVDKCIKIRGDQIASRQKLEVGLMIAMGESLLGDYAQKKEIKKIKTDQTEVGRVYHLYLKEKEERICFFNHEQLCTFLSLARMCSTDDEKHYTRLVNKGEGFTPPGLLMGLMYAWYIDNRFATHIEYKMSVMKINQTDLIPEQLKMVDKRRKMIGFFKDVIFGGYHER